MAYISEIDVSGTLYYLKDAEVRSAINGSGDLFEALIDTLYPVGSIYLSVNNTVPFSHGTWTKIGAGKALVGVDTGSSVTAMRSAGGTFGTADATLPSHNHSGSSGAYSTSVTTGSSGAHTHSMKQLWSAGSTGSYEAYTMSTKRTLTTRYTESAGSHTHSVSIPSHKHTIASDGTTAVNKNYQPSIAIYVWKRTA